ncbi:MAG: prepilin-type N-terminal cleavage/methylation domain-containing protein, partial [Erysipelotrichales bacterium]
MKKNKGFTLIEVVVVAAIIAVMLSGVYVIFDQGIKMFAKDRTQVENQESIRTTMTSIEKKIRKADHPTQPLYMDGSCLVVRSATKTDTYCKTGNTMTLNGNTILDRISTFTASVKIENDYYSVTMEIASIADSMGQVNSLTQTYNVRRG